MRFLTRQVHQTLVDHIRTEMATLGWDGPDVPFDSVPVTWIEVDPEDVADATPNTVSITVPDEGEDFEAEMGARQPVGGSLGLHERMVPLYIDVYGEKPSITTSICSDLKDILRTLALDVKDYMADPPIADPGGSYVEVERARIIRPPASYGADDFKRHWRTVEVDMTVYFNPDGG